MTFRARFTPTRPSKRAIANHLEFLSGGTDMKAPNTPARTTPRKQPESKINDAIIKAARYFGSILYRNRRGMVRLPNGGMFPYGLGPNGFPDNCGHTPIRITPEMVGRVVGVATYIEAKTETGVLATHQAECIEELRRNGCIAGVAVCGEDVRGIIKEWERG